MQRDVKHIFLSLSLYNFPWAKLIKRPSPFYGIPTPRIGAQISLSIMPPFRSLLLFAGIALPAGVPFNPNVRSAAARRDTTIPQALVRRAGGDEDARMMSSEGLGNDHLGQPAVIQVPSQTTPADTSSAAVATATPQSHKLTILLIPGAWHTPVFFGGLIGKLNGRGLDTRTLQLPTTATSGEGATSPADDADAHTDAAAVSELLARLVHGEDREVLVLAHSYGTLAAMEAVAVDATLAARRSEGRRGGVMGVLSLSGMLVVPGGTIGDTTGAAPPAWTEVIVSTPLPHPRRRQATVLAPAKPTSAPASEQPNPPQPDINLFIPKPVSDPAESKFFNDLSPDLAALWASRLVAQSLSIRSTPMHQPAYGHVPFGYIYGTRDNFAPLALRERVVGRVREATGAVVEEYYVDAGHDMWLSHMAETVGVLMRFLGDVVYKM